MDPRPHGMSVRFAVVLVLFQLAVPVVLASQDAKLGAREIASVSDAARYRAIAEHAGTPYRDFAVEYPPGALATFHAVGPDTADGFRRRLFALQVVCQALVVFLLFRYWSARAGWSYLLLSAPLLFVVYGGFDLVSVALTVVAATLARHRRPVAGGLGFVAGAFTKLWPLVLLPGLLVARQFRAFAIAPAAGGAGLVAWIAWGGTGAVGQVVSYRGARGWEFESIPGSTLRFLTRGALRFEAGSWRVGDPPGIIAGLVTLALIGVVARASGGSRRGVRRYRGWPRRLPSPRCSCAGRSSRRSSRSGSCPSRRSRPRRARTGSSAGRWPSGS